MISKNIFLEGQGRVRVSYIKGRCTYNNSIKLGSLTPLPPCWYSVNIGTTLWFIMLAELDPPPLDTVKIHVAWKSHLKYDCDKSSLKSLKG